MQNCVFCLGSLRLTIIHSPLAPAGFPFPATASAVHKSPSHHAVAQATLHTWYGEQCPRADLPPKQVLLLRCLVIGSANKRRWFSGYSWCLSWNQSSSLCAGILIKNPFPTRDPSHPSLSPAVQASAEGKGNECSGEGSSNGMDTFHRGNSPFTSWPPALGISSCGIPIGPSNRTRPTANWDNDHSGPLISLSTFLSAWHMFFRCHHYDWHPPVLKHGDGKSSHLVQWFSHWNTLWVRGFPSHVWLPNGIPTVGSVPWYSRHSA